LEDGRVRKDSDLTKGATGRKRHNRTKQRAQLKKRGKILIEVFINLT